MGDLRDSFNKLVKETLTVEDLRQAYSQEQTLDFRNNEENTQQTTHLNSPELSERNQDTSQSEKKTADRIVNRHKIRYTATRIKYSPTTIKSRNFLSNISYTGINKSDFYNKGFILDVYVLLVKNLNPFSMNRKVSDKNKHEMAYMLWRECIPPKFYRYICEGNNFIYLNGKDVGQPGVLEIVGNFKQREPLYATRESPTIQRYLPICLFARFSRSLYIDRKARFRHEEQFPHHVQDIS